VRANVVARTIRQMDDPLVTREELSQTLLAILDIRENVARIRAVIEEDENGEDPEEPT